MVPLPLEEDCLCSFVAFLATEKLKHRSINTYLSAVCHLQIREGFPDPAVQMPRLEYVLRGIKRSESEDGGGGWERLPITPHILQQLWGVWAPMGHLRDTKLIWALATIKSSIAETGHILFLSVQSLMSPLFGMGRSSIA